MSLGNEYDKGGPECKEDVNKRWVFRCKYEKDYQCIVDPDAPDIVDDDPYPPVDFTYEYFDLQYESVLKYVDKNQARYKDLYLPKKSLVTYDIQVRIDHEPSNTVY